MARAIALTDQQAQAFSAADGRLQATGTDLATAAVRDLVSQLDDSFATAAPRVLEKTRELFRRLI